MLHDLAQRLGHNRQSRFFPTRKYGSVLLYKISKPGRRTTFKTDVERHYMVGDNRRETACVCGHLYLDLTGLQTYAHELFGSAKTEVGYSKQGPPFAFRRKHASWGHEQKIIKGDSQKDNCSIPKRISTLEFMKDVCESARS